MIRRLGLIGLAAALLVGCGSDGPSYRSKVDAAYTRAQAAGLAAADVPQDRRESFVENMAEACAGDDTAMASARLLLSTDGVDELVRFVMSRACPDRLDQLDA